MVIEIGKGECGDLPTSSESFCHPWQHHLYISLATGSHMHVDMPNFSWKSGNRKYVEDGTNYRSMGESIQMACRSAWYTAGAKCMPRPSREMSLSFGVLSSHFLCSSFWRRLQCRDCSAWRLRTEESCTVSSDRWRALPCVAGLPCHIRARAHLNSSNGKARIYLHGTYHVPSPVLSVSLCI